jgi:hypothetical protein
VISSASKYTDIEKSKVERIIRFMAELFPAKVQNVVKKKYTLLSVKYKSSSGFKGKYLSATTNVY